MRAWGAGGKGPQLYCQSPDRLSNSVTTVIMPEGLSSDPLRKAAIDRYNLSLGGGLGPLMGKVFRIGHMGDLNEPMLLGCLATTELAMKTAGVPFSPGGVDAAIDAALAVLERSLALGMTAALAWELFELVSFVTRSTELPTAYADTLGDLLAGWVGAGCFAVTAAAAWPLRTRVPGDTATWFAGGLLLAAATAYFLRPWGSQQGWAGELAWPHYLVVVAVSWALVACVEPRPSPRRRASRPAESDWLSLQPTVWKATVFPLTAPRRPPPRS